ncbi:protein kinase [Aureococcus anophagefferens]|nr:protein kinase [Aureococcus anophagefferens]
MEPYAPRPDAAMATTAPSRLRRLTLDVLDTYTRVGAGRPAGAGAPGRGRGFAEWIRLSTTPRAPGRPSVVPRRSLTAPNVGGGNEGRDNAEAELICYAGDVLGPGGDGPSFEIIDKLGKGSFGQVFRCRSAKTGRLVAIKVVKNCASYATQALVESQIARMLNSRGAHPHVVHLFGDFSHGGHILSALVCLDDAKIVHCDVKPENILLSPRPGDDGASVVKLIDFGSACVEGRSTQTYVQSRFYRAPEVLVGAPYDGAIDVWSAACVVAELMLGLPVFPGVSAHNQITRIVEMLGTFPDALLERGDDAAKYFFRKPDAPPPAAPPQPPPAAVPDDAFDDDGADAKFSDDDDGPASSYELKTPEAYARDTGSSVPRTKKYFQYKRLDEIVNHYPIRAGLSASDVDAERDKRKVFAHFVRGMLRHAPDERWTPRMAAAHPDDGSYRRAVDAAPRAPPRRGESKVSGIGMSLAAHPPEFDAGNAAPTPLAPPFPPAYYHQPGAYYYPPPQYSPDAAFAPLRRNNTMTEAQWRDAAARQAGASSYGAQGAFSYTAGYPGAGVARFAGAFGETDFSFALQRPTAGPSFHPRAPRSPASDDGQPPGEYYGSAPGYGGGNAGGAAPGPFLLLELILHDFFTKACVRTRDPEAADLFFVPHYGDVLYRETGRGDKPSAYEAALLDILERQDTTAWERTFNVTGEYWTRRGGGDHVLLSRSFVAEYPACGRKNVVAPYPIPGRAWHDGQWARKARKAALSVFGPALPSVESSRPLAAYYRAGDHGCVNVRRAIAAEFADASLDQGGVGDGGFVLRDRAVDGADDALTKLRTQALRVPRQALMHLADFCPCPEGDSPSAKRQYDALLAGCVPVVVSDDALWAYSNEMGLDGDLDPSPFALNVSEASLLKFDADPDKQTTVNTKADAGHAHHAGRDDADAFPLLGILGAARRRLAAFREAGATAAWAYRYYATGDYGDEDPLLAGVFPNGGALALLVRDLERRARGKTKDPAKRAAVQAALDAYEGGRVFRRRR